MSVPTTVALSRFAEEHPFVRRMLAPAIAVRRWARRRGVARQQELFDRLTRLLVDDPCLRIEEFDGEFYLDSRSHLFQRLAWTGQYEPALTRVCLRHFDAHRDVLDIGANVGFHAVLFGKRTRAGRVLSVEPTPGALARLRRNLARNGLSDRVEVFEGVVTDSAGSAEIRTIPGREEYSSLGAMIHPSISGAPVEVLSVKAITLDELIAERGLRPGFMKIDVEGFEYRVLAGAERTLREHRPVILAEMSDPLLRANGASSQQLIAMIERHGYLVTDPLRPGSPPGLREYGDILCLPA